MDAPAITAMTETETTLRLTSGERQETLRKLQTLEKIGPYLLLNPRRETVRDRYLDTPGNRLKKTRYALRIRQIDEALHITLKGPSTRNDDGSRSRLEIELPFTSEATARVFRELASRGVRLRGDWNCTEPPSREDLLDGARLAPFQERVMIRETRDLVEKEADADPIAEMVIDQVAYRPGGLECRHAEMEIELKPGCDPAHLGPAARLFLDRFRDRLVLWFHGKLAIGLALEQLFKDGLQPGLLDDHHWLTEEAYRRIRRPLRR